MGLVAPRHVQREGWSSSSDSIRFHIVEIILDSLLA